MTGGWGTPRVPNPEQIAEQLGVGVEDIQRAIDVQAKGAATRARIAQDALEARTRPTMPQSDTTAQNGSQRPT